MSLIGPSRHFVVMQQFGRFRGEADIARTCCWLDRARLTHLRHGVSRFFAVQIDRLWTRILSTHDPTLAAGHFQRLGSTRYDAVPEPRESNEALQSKQPAG